MAHKARRLSATRTGIRSWRQRHALLLVLVLVLAGASGRCLAQEHSRAELRAEVAGLQGVVRACAAAASECRPQAAPDNEIVAAEGGQPQVRMRWYWLSDALDKAGKASPDDRRHLMESSAARLSEITSQVAAGPDAASQASFAQARSTADKVLSRPEFGAVAPPGPWDRFVAKVWSMIGKLFAGVGRLGIRAPWLSTVCEWLFFLGAAVGLLVFVLRNFQRQRLAAQLRGEQAVRTAWDREATDWAALAEKAATDGEWREAVHCLYWAAIVRLEGRRLWRHNPARTPREYVRLLKPGTVQRESLGGLTGLLERVWYGLRPAVREDYQRARSWFERLSEPTSGGERA